MKLKQLSLFLENKPGTLSAPCRILAEAGINLLTLTVADTLQFGILRIVVRDWEKAKKILEDHGCVVKVSDVVAIEVDDRPGGMMRILDVLEKYRINVEYMYAFTSKQEDKGVLVFRFDDADGAIRAMQSNNISVVDSVALFKRMDA
ncbi:MAG TPA: ACT domain-containing protein [Candidatus Paceibacterota bacterium]|nr:ACT domain-containing protein [Verrucomicrobiota bacterium]HRY50977.1 ACT domain-containing protein [Candidatus Paceibacterota bacterium]HSA02144.1 ACT domain-containing protein [Candidatus Paceibacterota bacterium]